MNDKITIQELVEFISGNQSTSKKEVEAFAKEFFKLIEDALQTERYVKIKGFGTFKLIEVDSRESINVNTGERFEIQGHNKITFTPDATLKEVVNKPFAHFENVVLNDGVFFEEEPIVDEETPVTEEEPIIEEEAPIIEEPIIKEEPSPIPLLQEEEVPSTDVVGSDTEETAPIIEEPIIEEEPSRDAIHCVREEETPIIEEEEPTIEEAAPIIEEPIVEEEPLSRDVACSVREEETPIIEEEEPIIEEEPSPIPLLQEGGVPSGGVVGSDTEEETPIIEEPIMEEEPSRDAIHCVREEETPIIEEPIIEEEPSPLPLIQEGGVPSGGVVGSDTEEETPKPTGFIAESITNIESDLETNKRPESMIDNIKNTIVNDFKQDTQGMKYFFGIVIFIILLCIAAIVFLYHPTLLTDMMPKPQEHEETTEEATPEEVIPADTLAIQADTLAVQTDTIVAQPDTVVAPVVELPQPTPPPVVEEKPQPAPQPATTYKASDVYTITGTQAEHVIKRGETLRIISEKYFGTRELYTYIIEYNKDIISNPNNVSVGTKIKIPKLEKK